MTCDDRPQADAAAGGPSGEASEPVGFIGLGAMGAQMTRRLLEAGVPVVVHDRDAGRMEEAARHGARPASCAAEVARQARIVFIMVVDADQVRSVLFGPEGTAKASAAGHCVVILSTIGPDPVRRIAGELAARSIAVVDAPVSGGTARAATGELLIMVGADDQALSQARGCLDILGSNVVICSPEPGGGQEVKLINQLLCGVHIAVSAEALAMAAAMNLDAGKVLDTISAGAAASFMLSDRGPRMLGAHPPVRSALDIFVKDLRLVLAETSRVGFTAPLATAALSQFQHANAMGIGSTDDSQIIRVYRNPSTSLTEHKEAS